MLKRSLKMQVNRVKKIDRVNLMEILVAIYESFQIKV